MVPQLLQPPGHILVGLMLADVVDQQSPNGAAVVGRGDCSIAFLPGRVPDLGLDGLAVDADGTGCKLDADCRFGVEVEFVTGEPAEQVGLPNSRVSD